MQTALNIFPHSRCTGNGTDGALQADEEAVVPRSVPVHIAYELQKPGHCYLDVR